MNTDPKIRSKILPRKPGTLHTKSLVVDGKPKPTPKESVILGTENFSKTAYGVSGMTSGMGLSGLVGAGAALGAMSLASVGTMGMMGAALPMGAMIGGIAGAILAESLHQKTSTEHTEEVAQLRNKDGRFRTKTGKVHLDTLRETYGEKFAAGLPGNMPLQVLRAATGTSLTQMVKHPEKIDGAREKLKDWKAPEPAPGGRVRNADGRIRQKRGDTRIDTLRKAYGPDFAAQLPGNWPLQVVRAATGMSLSQLVDKPEKIQEALPKVVAEAVQMKEAKDLSGAKAEVQGMVKKLDETDLDLMKGFPGKVMATDPETGTQVFNSLPGRVTKTDSVEGHWQRRSVSFHQTDGQTKVELRTPASEGGTRSVDVTVDDHSGRITNVEDRDRSTPGGVDLNRLFRESV